MRIFILKYYKNNFKNKIFESILGFLDKINVLKLFLFKCLIDIILLGVAKMQIQNL